MDEKIISEQERTRRWMLNRLHHYKLYKVKRSDWRTKLADENHKRGEHSYPSEEFIAAWDFLYKEGLI